jgi:hypothetical protein
MTRYRWEDNIRMDLTEILKVADCIKPAQNRDQWWDLVNIVMNSWVPYIRQGIS